MEPAKKTPSQEKSQNCEESEVEVTADDDDSE
jgi:hypothetical protein